MKLTIVIPTFNAADDIEGCLESIANSVGARLGTSIAVRVQDGGSDDGTAKLVLEASLPGTSVSVEADGGVYDGMNRAVAGLESDWLYFLGADDRLLPGFLSAVDCLNNPAEICYANAVFKSDQRRYDGTFGKLKLVYRNICHQATFYPRQALADSPFNLAYTVYADWAKNIELMATTHYRYLPFDVCRYNDLSGLSHCANDDAFEREKAGLFLAHHGLLYAFLSRTAAVPTWLYKRLGSPALNGYQGRHRAVSGKTASSDR